MTDAGKITQRRGKPRMHRSVEVAIIESDGGDERSPCIERLFLEMGDGHI